jgi:hypothetical protein
MTTWLGKGVAVVLGLAVLAGSLLVVQAQDKDKPAGKDGGAKSLEDLLKETGLAFARHQDQNDKERVFYKVTFEGGGEVSVTVAEEYKPWAWKYKDGSQAQPIYLWTTIAPLPKDFKPPLAMLRKVAELNHRFVIGSISLVGDGIYHNCGFFRRNLDSDTLLFYVANLHHNRVAARKELLPFLQEAKGDK